MGWLHHSSVKMSLRGAVYDPSGLIFLGLLLFVNNPPVAAVAIRSREEDAARQRVSLNSGWRFLRSTENIDNLVYDGRPDTSGTSDRNNSKVLKPWILPSANDFINDPAKRHERPDGNPGEELPFV